MGLGGPIRCYERRRLLLLLLLLLQASPANPMPMRERVPGSGTDVGGVETGGVIQNLMCETVGWLPLVAARDLFPLP